MPQIKAISLAFSARFVYDHGMDRKNDIRRMWLSFALALTAGFLAVAGLAGLGLVALFAARVLGPGAVPQALAAFAVIAASVALGAACGTFANGKTSREGRIIAVLIIGSSLIGAAAGALAYATQGLGFIALAGLLGTAGAVVSARASCAFHRWIERAASKLPPENRC